MKIHTLKMTLKDIYLAYEATLPTEDDAEIGLYDSGMAQIHQEICDDLGPLALGEDRELALVREVLAWAAELATHHPDHAEALKGLVYKIYGGEP